MKKLGVLVSGTGSILQAMIKKDVPIGVVLADRPCPGLEIAKKAKIETILVDRKQYGFPQKGWDRDAFSRAVAEELQKRGVELVAMAGFMTLFSQPMFDFYEGSIINAHPAYLPEFPGDTAVKDALEAGVKETGCTVHIAVLEMDAGPILAQKRVPIFPGDTEETLHERIKMEERELFPQTVLEQMAA